MQTKVIQEVVLPEVSTLDSAVMNEKKKAIKKKRLKKIKMDSNGWQVTEAFFTDKKTCERTSYKLSKF